VYRESVGSLVKKPTFPKYIKGLIIWEFWVLPTLPTLLTLLTLPTLSFFLFLFSFSIKPRNNRYNNIII
jgi:hypothetical protein